MSVKISDLTNIATDPSTDSIEVSRDNGDGTFSSYKTSMPLKGYIGMISYFAGNQNDPKFLLCDGSEYSSTMYPDLAASGLTQNVSVPGGVEGSTFLEYASVSGDAAFGTTEPLKSVRYDSNRYLVSSGGSGDYRSALINIDSATARAWITFNDSGGVGLLTAIDNTKIFPELDNGTHMPAIALNGSEICSFWVPNDIPTTASGLVTVDVLNFQTISNTGFTANPMDTSYASSGYNAFYDSVLGEVVILMSDGSVGLYVASTSDFITFTYNTNLMSGAIASLAYAGMSNFDQDGGWIVTANGSPGDLFHFATSSDLKTGVFQQIPVVQGVNSGVDKSPGFFYITNKSRWIIPDCRSSIVFSGDIYFYDPVTNTSEVYTFDQATYGIDFSTTNINRPDMTIVENGAIVTIDSLDKAYYFESAVAPPQIIDFAADGVTYLAEALVEYDSASQNLLVHSGNALQYSARYLINLSSTTAYFLPTVPDAGDAKAYIRALKE